jgi:hypothetical protein
MAGFKKWLAGKPVSKQQRVSSASNSSSARTNTSGIATTSRSASMRSTGFVPKIKFVDQDTQLMFSNERDSVCQFVISRCNLHPNISPHEWWKHTHKYVNQTINRLLNDRNTAMMWATLGQLHHVGC